MIYGRPDAISAEQTPLAADDQNKRIPEVSAAAKGGENNSLIRFYQRDTGHLVMSSPNFKQYLMASLISALFLNKQNPSSMTELSVKEKYYLQKKNHFI